jgi:hypothetical protein
MISEVAIRLGHARSLAGVVHFPSSGLPRAAVIFLDGQDGSKVGPQRMFVHAILPRKALSRFVWIRGVGETARDVLATSRTGEAWRTWIRRSVS